MKFKFLIVLLLVIGYAAMADTTKTFTVTAYCGCVKCCGKWAAVHKTADGHTPKQGVTCAAPRSIPFGTKLVIDGRTYTVQDRLAEKYDSRIDVYFENHNEALKWGKRKLSVKIIDKVK